jgi:4-amino-4-deoxy-L-arabinose transferase-like glycosyltransferase
VGGLGVLLVGVLSTRLFGPTGGRAGALVAALYPPLVWISGYALSEALFWPVGLLCAWLYDRVWAEPGSASHLALACGLATGVALLVRPSVLLFVPLALVALAVRHRLRTAAALTAGVLLVVGPWTFRNYAVHGRLMFVASDGGVTFWTGNNPLAIGEGDMAANPAMRRADQALRSQHPGLTEEQMEPVYYREAARWILENPAQFAMLELKKAFYTVVPIGPSYRLHSTRYVAASVLSYLTVASLALLSLWRHPRVLSASPGLVCLGVSSLLICVVFFPQERFRIPIIDPLLAVLASGALGRFMRAG